MGYTKRNSKTERTILNNYKGYPIFTEVVTYYKRCVFNSEYYDTNLISSRSVHYCCGTKNGDITKDSDRYAHCCYSLDSVKKLIDDIEDGKIVLTEKEYHDWVIAPNRKNGWGFSTKTLMNLMKAFKKASSRRRAGYLERLEDANFHSECSALEEENYEEFERLAKSL